MSLWWLAPLLVALAATGFYVWLRWKRTHPGWQRPIPRYFAESAYACPRGYPPERITQAMQMAETCLLKFGKRWNAGQLGAVCLRAHVMVLPTYAVPDLGGLDVHGVSNGHALQVGWGLATLAHELAHLAETVLDKELDASHSTWERDGIWRAVSAFEEWAVKQGWETL